MAKFVKGDVVVVPFPFSDLTQSKRRPAFVASALEGDDLILCQITSQSIKDNYAILLNDSDFETGGLKQQSNVRPNRIFTADDHIILYKIGKLNPDKVNEIIEKLVKIIRSPS
ncbi:MAG: type II toxin-antitoxin system PemK/MazF family toxin [Deltaproteobacteria bacterium]|nr:type II toxin-antitoxin system PemK/MazF family toxin [Deltaproteobacteria bacterium]MCL5277825.1 type II toxin-antitoxin system PemK/MazF family toxin [Deltaproteobacteria bacterium]